jgi:hypothetical protein
MDGEQVGQVAAAGTLRNVFAPIRIGATTQSQHFDGLIDEVWLSTNVVSKDEIMGLSCIRRPSMVAITPARGAPVPFDTPVNYQISVTNQDIGRCGSSSYEAFFNGFSGVGDGGTTPSNAGINVNINPFFIDVMPGATAAFSVDASATEDAEPGLHTLPFSVIKFGQSFEFFQVQALFELTEPTGCFVRTRRELMITSTSVVDDPIQRPSTRTIPTAHPESRGVWTFGRLMRDMAPTPEEAPVFTERLFQTWLTDQTVNGFTVFARPDMQSGAR